ncbi:MAG: hypothetical protein Q8N30_05215 [Methylococcales bacterium]|nr:hypothetical protein [Methylococcales bacterium]
MDKPDFSTVKSTYLKVRQACEYILGFEGYADSGNTLPSKILFEKVKNEFPDYFSNEIANTFYQYLSNSVRDSESSINCLGRHKGYYLSTIAAEKIEESESSENIIAVNLDEGISSTSEYVGRSTKRNQKEILLYPILESWLVTQGYQAKDISSTRALGKWGNPDVAGINALDAFNGLSIELVTIEAKTSLDNWEVLIFEAISHRRFANRAYFAFAQPEETANKIPSEMRYYAELYGIGILVLSVDDTKYKQLHDGDLSEPLKAEDVEVIEIFSAPYNFVQPKYQLKFCEALDISCLKKLYHWGRAEK